MKVHSFCQEDRLFTSGTDGVGGVDELILHLTLPIGDDRGDRAACLLGMRRSGARSSDARCCAKRDDRQDTSCALAQCG